MTPARGEVWLFDLGMAEKVRPALVVSGDYTDLDRALVTIVPHTTTLRGSQYEIVETRPPRAHRGRHVHRPRESRRSRYHGSHHGPSLDGKSTGSGFARLDRYRACLERTYHRCVRATRKEQNEANSTELAEKKFEKLLNRSLNGPPPGYEFKPTRVPADPTGPPK